MNAKKYGQLNAELSGVLDKLTREYCASDVCPNYKSKMGCCDRPDIWPKGFEDNDSMLEAQITEAIENGWDGQIKKKHCTYLVKGQGCLLKKYKTPICIGMLCPPVQKKLMTKYGKENTREFLKSMFKLVSCYKGGRDVINQVPYLEKEMQNAINSGEKLLTQG